MGATDQCSDPDFDVQQQRLKDETNRARTQCTDKLRGLDSLFGPGVYLEVQLAVERLDEAQQDRQHLMARHIDRLEADLDAMRIDIGVQMTREDHFRSLLIAACQDEQARLVRNGKPDPEWLVEAVQYLGLHYLDPRPASHDCKPIPGHMGSCIGPRCPRLNPPGDGAAAIPEAF